MRIPTVKAVYLLMNGKYNSLNHLGSIDAKTIILLQGTEWRMLISNDMFSDKKILASNLS